MALMVMINKTTGEVGVENLGESPCVLCDNNDTCDHKLKLECLSPCG